MNPTTTAPKATVPPPRAVPSRRESGAAATAAIERPTRRSRKTRLALVEAARALLEEQGAAALTVKAVTERADVGHGTFYHHFASTESVIVAGLEESMRELSEEMMRNFSDADDKVWVFVASLSSTFRMLAAHPALGWMLERPHVLATALREACGPFALRDVNAMIEAGDVRADALGHATRYWEWLMIGALVDAAANTRDHLRIEASLVELVLRVVGIGAPRSTLLLTELQGKERQAKELQGGAATTRARGARKR